MKRQPIAIDVFGGAGGLTEGLLASGVNVVLSIEKHPHAALTHAFNHPSTCVLCGDISELSARSILSQLKRQTGSTKIDIVVGGPPCQGFSPAGRQCELDPRNELVHQFIRIVAELVPECFVFENVPAILEVSSGRVIRSLLDAFWSLGYLIYGINNESEYYPDTFPVVDSSWFGVPQKRKRLILVGWRSRFDSFRWLRETGGVFSPLRKVAPVTIYEAIGDLDLLRAGYECHRYQKIANSKYQGARRSKNDVLYNHLATNHKPETLEMFKLFEPGATTSSIPRNLRTGKQRVRRFAKNDISPAILALPDDYIHYSQHRIPTVRELARLQSFDDDFVFLGKRTTSDRNRRFDVPQYTQVGNAVPPLLARSLGKRLVKAFGARSRDLRNRVVRACRHRALLGSSAFAGYQLHSSVASSLNLFDLAGDRINLSFNHMASPIPLDCEPSSWAVLPPAA